MTRTFGWLGHATVLIEAGGFRLLTDPVLRGRVAHLHRHAPAPLHPERIDAVLLSHVHHDHFDRPSLRRLAAPGVTAVVPAGAARLLRGMPFGTVHEVDAGDTVTVGGVEVRVVQAWHDGRRRPGTRPLPTLGYLTGGVWFAGDTDLNPEMAALQGEVDVALLPIWGWGPSLGPGHLDPDGAAEVVALVRPRVVIPIHWGTFLPIGLHRRHGHLLTSPPVRFAAQVAELAPATRVEVVPPGGSVSL